MKKKGRREWEEFESVWVCGSLLAFQRPHIIFVRVFYLQSHCFHKVPVFALLAHHFETFTITGLLWTWWQSRFHSKKSTRPTCILMCTHINSHTLTEGQFGWRGVWVNSVSPWSCCFVFMDTRSIQINLERLSDAKPVIRFWNKLQTAKNNFSYWSHVWIWWGGCCCGGS